MEPSQFDESVFFRALAESGVRALLIGRRALVLLGLPVLTAGYAFWIAIDDIERFNAVAAAFNLHPSVGPEDARRRGRYVLENDGHVDVLVARSGYGACDAFPPYSSMPPEAVSTSVFLEKRLPR